VWIFRPKARERRATVWLMRPCRLSERLATQTHPIIRLGTIPNAFPEPGAFDRTSVTASISAIVMSAVASVSTPGVLVTVIPVRRRSSHRYGCRPEIGNQFSRPGGFDDSLPMRSVTVGTRMSALAAAASAPPSSGLWSGWFGIEKIAEASSMPAGSLRVTMTSGLSVAYWMRSAGPQKPRQAVNRRAARLGARAAWDRTAAADRPDHDACDDGRIIQRAERLSFEHDGGKNRQHPNDRDDEAEEKGFLVARCHVAHHAMKLLRR
jgi:hypothetical protein